MRAVVITLLGALTISLALSVAAAQKKDKRWTEWSIEDAEKILNDSPWAKTQVDTETTQKLYSRNSESNLSTDTVTAGTTARLARGAVNQNIDIRFHVRLFSARPVRQALARIIELQQKPKAEVLTRLHGFAETKSNSSIIITITFESNEPAYLGATMRAFTGATTAVLSSKTYLETSDGKRIFLQQYVPPGKDGFGARFIFPRLVDGPPFLTPNSGELRFHTEYPGLEIDRRFKVADMLLKGELEY
ncbi:MAG TPA: hypothetical protein VJV21_05850 [Pyrinomonadaceae bacterium]|nr:hypothetical protein [Pyrinomonadaceae bacterium]